MPKIESHPAGSFCWVELATTDQANAKSFYSSLFSWTPIDSPISPTDLYTIFKLHGDTAAAAYTMAPAEQAAAPPHWNLYIAVENADHSAARATELGGKVLAGPFDVMTAGRMAILQDPTAAPFCIWQAKDQPGLGVSHENGAFCWADLRTTDPAAAKRFYEILFGWKIEPQPNYPPEYLVVLNPQPIAGIARSPQPFAPPQWMLFFLALDVDAATLQAKNAYGSVLLAPTSVGGARMAVLTDPQGAPFSLIQPPTPPNEGGKR